MPKYYCDYCKSYLTHDTMSVRKSHLQGEIILNSIVIKQGKGNKYMESSEYTYEIL